MEIIKQLFEQNVSMSKIAKIVNKSQATVSRLCKKYKLTRNSICAIISDNELLQHQNMSTYEIAQKFKISPQAVHERQVKLGINKPLCTLTDKIADKVRKHHVDLSHFEKLDDIGSYWLGMLFADGSVHQHSGNKPHYISVGLTAKDEDWLLQYCNDIGLNTYKIQKYTDKHGFKRVNIRFSNIHFARLLWKYGLDPRQNYKTTIPNNILPNHFIRGFLDGDGSISIKKGRISKRTGIRGASTISIRIYAENYLLAKNLLKFISNSGVIMNGPYKTKSIWVITATHKKAIKLARWIWDNPTRSLDRKYQIYLSYDKQLNIS